ncbi:hypothetical protein HID58_005980, partial [Brassica napus]
MPLWRETSVELSSLRSKGLHPCGQCWICFCALRSKGSLAVSVLLRPFSFEGRRRLEEVAFLCCCATNKVTSSPAFTISKDAADSTDVRSSSQSIMVLSRGSQLLTGVRIRDIKSEQKWTADSGDTAVLSLAIVNLPVGVSASAAAASSMRTVVVRFADADAAAYHITTADFIGVSRRTQRSDAASDAASCDAVQRRRNVQGEMAFLKERETVLLPFLSQGRVNGDVLQATWREDLTHGKGWFYFNKGDRWFANFWKGNASGEGRFYSKSDKRATVNASFFPLRYSETWDDGVLIDQKRCCLGTTY